MAIIDFTEIPAPYHEKHAGKPAGKKSGPNRTKSSSKASAKVAAVEPSASTDLDAFEKFASEFFTHICGCKVVESAARGQDGGRDLVVEGEISPDVKGRFLVSCKHKANSGTAVNTDRDEPNVKGRLDASGAQFFIGFYSTIASTGLRRHLEDTRSNNKGFDFIVFNSADIESRLISVDEPRGWLLAARHFPKSMSNLFQRFVVPIKYYTATDVKKSGGGLRLDGPYGSRSGGPKDSADLDKVKQRMADEANDALTSNIHSAFFCDALLDFIRLLPNTFVRLPDADPTNLELSEVAPNFDVSSAAIDNGHHTTLRIVAAVWSFWDGSRAAQWLLERTSEPTATGEFSESKIRRVEGNISIGQVIRFCNGQYRDILARLLAFCPTSLAPVPIENLIVRNGKRLGLENQLEIDFKNIVSGLDGFDKSVMKKFNGVRADENGWRQLIATIDRDVVLKRLPPTLLSELELPPLSLGNAAQSPQIGFNRTAYSRWLEESLGLPVPRLQSTTVGTFAKDSS